MSGRIDVAPCGHTGEVIIGTYIKCLQGCEGEAVHPKRGELGHVRDCACKPCQIRRKTVTIVIRDKGGTDWMKVDWDGSTDVIIAKSSKSGYLRHYKFLDADGKVVGSGSTEGYCDPGEIKIHAKKMLDAIVSSTVAKWVVEEIVNEADYIQVMVGGQTFKIKAPTQMPMGFFVP